MKGSPAKSELPREPATIAYDMSTRLKGGALPFGLLYRSGTEESIAFRVLAQALRNAVEVICAAPPPRHPSVHI